MIGGSEPSTTPSSTRVEVAEVRQRLRQVMLKRLEAQLVPYEGQWLAPAELAAKQRAEKRTAWVRALELTLVYAIGTLISLLILIVLRNLVY